MAYHHSDPIEGYYNVHFPDLSVSSKQRFFFFDSLYTKQDSHFGPNIAGEEIAEQVNNIIQSGLQNLNKKNDKDGKTIITQSLDFLQKLIQSSQKDEMNWLKQHIFNNKEIPDQLREKISAFFKKTDEIDYLEFITYFNICLNGLSDYEYLLEYEQKRLTDLQTIWEKINNLRSKEYNKLRTKAKNSLVEKNKNIDNDSILAEMFTEFLITQTQIDPENKKFYSDMLHSQTLINKIASVLDSVFNTIWNSEQYKSIIASILQVDSLDKLSETSVAFFISEIAQQSLQAINEILDSCFEENAENEQEALKKRSQRIIDAFINKLGPLDSLEAASDDTIVINYLQKLVKKVQSIEKDLEQNEILKTRLFTKLKVTGMDANSSETQTRKRSGLQGLTKEINEVLEPLLNEELKKVNIKKKSWGRRRKGKAATQRSRIIDKLQALINSGFYDKLFVNRKKKGNLLTYEKMAIIARKLLNDNLKIHFNSKSNVLSELKANQSIRDAIDYQELARQFLSPTNLTRGYDKSDTELIELGSIEILPSFEKEFNNFAKAIVQEIFAAPHKIDTTEFNFSNAIKERESNMREEAGYSPTEFFLKGETYKRTEQWKQMITKLHEESQKKGKRAKAARAALNSLKKSFKVSTSVKSYDKYDNTRGFHGGSLGASLEHQVDNILNMFELGGITSIDRDWLLFSIYNSGAELVGAPYKKDLEHFLSILAVSLMFSDAGEQAQWIQSHTGLKEDVTSQFLHLYLLNGFYFPASYILQLTYNELMRIYRVIETTEKALSTGSQVEIINTVSHSGLVGERSANGRIYTKEPQNWFDTFSKNKSKVTLQVTFLAGLLDIINALENFNINA